MLRFLGTFLVMLSIATLAGCHGAANTLIDPVMPTLPQAGPGPTAVDPQALVMPHYDAAFAAGDTTLMTADNAIQELRSRLQAQGYGGDRLHLLSADPARFSGDFFLSEVPVNVPEARRPALEQSPDRLRKLPGGIDPATPAQLLRRVLALAPGPSGACFVYLATSPSGDGFAMGEGTLTADTLDRALAGGCADVPTVLVVSACQSGTFLTLARPNRLIFVAAGAGESGFGCGPNVGLTTFDECFLGALDGGGLWRAVFERTQFCVNRRQSLTGQAGVAPRVSLGALVTTLVSPVRAAEGAAPLIFRQGVGRFTADAVPYFSTLRRRNQATIDAYLKAPTPKALALTYAGTVAVAVAETGRETPDDVSRIALARCEEESGGSCMLFARNDAIAAAGPSGLIPLHKPILPIAPVSGARTVETITEIPFLRADQQAVLRQYRQEKRPKALALGRDRAVFGVGTDTDQSRATTAATGACLAAGATSCVSFAEGDRLHDPRTAQTP